MPCSDHPQPPSPLHYPLSPAPTSDSECIDVQPHPVNYYDASPISISPSIPTVSPHLPPVNDLISFTESNYEFQESPSRQSSASSASSYSRRGSLISVNCRRGGTQSNQRKGTKRRYECATCGKTFTTSGHVARHNRIHTGEKNFQCPEPGCSQRFSRQDNCMYGSLI